MNKADNHKVDRRAFLGYSAVLGSGLLFPSKIYDRAEKNNPLSTDDLNIALLGAGSQGQVLMEACMKIPNLRFKAVCDIWQDFNLKRAIGFLNKYKHEATGYENYKEMLQNEKDIDAVIIATPDFWHAQQTVDCLEAGLHVYCEKEMSNTIEGAKKMVQTARKTKKLLQIGHQRRSNPRYIYCFERLIKDIGILGKITTINAQWNRSVQPPIGWPKKYGISPVNLEKYGYASMEQFRNWRWYRKLGGGPIVDLGSHQIDVFNWFLETPPHSVIAGGGTDYYDKKDHQWYDTVMAIYDYDTKYGKVRAFYQTITTNRSWGYFENIMGDQGSLNISESAGRGSIYREDAAPDWQKWVDLGYIKNLEEKSKLETKEAVLDVRETVVPPEYKIPVEMNMPYHQLHLENFFNSVRGKKKLNCPAEQSYETAVTVLKVNQSIEQDKRLFFKPEEFQA